MYLYYVIGGKINYNNYYYSECTCTSASNDAMYE
jgi:hypothetical protein